MSVSFHTQVSFSWRSSNETCNFVGYGSRHHPVAIAPGTDSIARETHIAATAHSDVERRTGATRIGQRTSAPLSHWERAGVRERSLAHLFDETFGVNS